MTINAMDAPPEAINHGCVDPRVTSDESGHDGFVGDAAPGVEQSDRSPMTMADGDLLLLSHGSLGDGWTQTGFGRKPRMTRRSRSSVVVSGSVFGE
jgi:hypothetical protein